MAEEKSRAVVQKASYLASIAPHSADVAPRSSAVWPLRLLGRLGRFFGIFVTSSVSRGCCAIQRVASTSEANCPKYRLKPFAQVISTRQPSSPATKQYACSPPKAHDYVLF